MGRDIFSKGYKSGLIKMLSWLVGLIATDGTISWPNATKSATAYNCQIKLSNKDEEILYRIQERFGGKIVQYKKDKKCMWAIKGKPFINYLRSIGFTHNKTITLDVTKWFALLDEDKKYSFVCGCIDGDGWIRKNKRAIGFCSGSYKFIQMISNFLNINKIETRDKHTGYGKNSKNNLYIIRLQTKKELRQLYEKLYIGRDLCMKRKKILVEKLYET